MKSASFLSQHSNTLTDLRVGLEFSVQDVPVDGVHGFGKDVHYTMFFVGVAYTECRYESWLCLERAACESLINPLSIRSCPNPEQSIARPAKDQLKNTWASEKPLPKKTNHSPQGDTLHMDQIVFWPVNVIPFTFAAHLNRLESGLEMVGLLALKVDPWVAVGSILPQRVPEPLRLSPFFIKDISHRKAALSVCHSWRTESRCEDSKHQGSESSSFLRISNKNMGLSVTSGRETLQRIPLCVDSSVREQTHTKESTKAADAIFHVSLWTIPSSQEEEGESEIWRKCEKMVLKTCQESKAIKKCPACLRNGFLWDFGMGYPSIHPPIFFHHFSALGQTLRQSCFHSLDKSPVNHI